MNKSFITSLVLGIFVTALAACGGEREVRGECQSVFEGDICAWGTMDGDDVAEFGVTVSMAVAENAPPGGEMVFPPPIVGLVAMPEEIASATGFDHLMVNWEPHGHPPGLFLTPHFDFHFYTVDPQNVQAVDCADLSKPAELSAGYTLPDLDIPGLGELVGLCVPQMGMHAMLEAELDDTDPFGISIILGYYEKDLVFLEPMIAQSKLLAAQSFTMDVPPVPDVSANVAWPTKFEAVYDEASRSYRFVFSGMSTE